MGLSLECGSNTIMLMTQEVRTRAELLQCKIDEINNDLVRISLGIARNVKRTRNNELWKEGYFQSLNACMNDLITDLKYIQDNAVELYHYPVKGVIVTTPNIRYAKIKARKMMQKSLVFGMLPAELLIRRRVKK